MIWNLQDFKLVLGGNLSKRTFNHLYIIKKLGFHCMIVQMLYGRYKMCVHLAISNITKGKKCLKLK